MTLKAPESLGTRRDGTETYRDGIHDANRPDKPVETDFQTASIPDRQRGKIVNDLMINQVNINILSICFNYLYFVYQFRSVWCP